MLRSLFSGVAGLQNHQARMDVIGNNIANVNTVAFKTSRMTFQDTMSQTLSNGASPSGTNGGSNPMQIGLGMKIGSVDTNFGQGILETTNMSSDLAIEGEGFFVVSDGSKNLYTRAGAFQIDKEGNLLAQGGQYHVQGRTADISGNISSGSTIGNIKLPFGQKSAAKATEEIKYHCNLDASADAKANIWSANWGMAAKAEGSALTFPLTLTAGQNFTLEIPGVTGTAAAITLPSTTTVNSLSELLTNLNTAVLSNPNLAGKVEVVANSSGNGIMFRTATKGGSDTFITPTSGTFDVTSIGLTSGVQNTGTTASKNLNELGIVTTGLNTGDTLTISGVNPDGSKIFANFTYGTDGNTVQDLLNRINSLFSGATASMNEKGQIVLTDSVKGTTSSSISLSFSDVDKSGSAMSIPSFSLQQKGVNAGSHTASIYAYDSLGNKHTVEVTFTKNQGQSNLWDWEAKVDGGNMSVTAGGSGYVSFNNDGSIARMEASDGQKLSFNPGGGASTMEINLNGGASGSFSGITQYNNPFTTIAFEQNGYTMGVLSNIFFDQYGMIYGEYTNGQKQKLAQVAVANFINENGLLKQGSNFYSESTNSGQAQVGVAGQTTSAAIRSGYLEASNVDLSKELTDMIVTQRGFQANTKVINTADTMLEELINRVKR